MKSMQVVCLADNEIEKEVLPAGWLGETAPELFREYLPLSADARAGILTERLNSLLSDANSDVLICKQGDDCLAIMGLDYLAWDSEHFGIECGKLAPYCLSGHLSRQQREVVHPLMIDAALEWARDKELKILQRRLLAGRLDEINALEHRGFHMVDQVATLTAPISRVIQATGPATSREPEFSCPHPDDLRTLQSMTSGAFPLSRFVNDRLLPARLGDELYVKWLSKTFNAVMHAGDGQSAAQNILVARVSGRIVGYIAFRIAPVPASGGVRRVASIELIVVDPECQGQGIGQRLFAAVARASADLGVDMMESTTWMNHRVSMASNQKAGLRVCEHMFTYHCYL